MDKPDEATERIENDKFLSELFKDELTAIRIHEPKNVQGIIVEIGAAGGNTKSVWPEVVTTDVRASIGVDRIMKAENIDFEDNSLKMLFGMDALHHVKEPKKHFDEIYRVLAIGGCAVYIEPNWNLFSKFCFKYLLRYLHPEPYNTTVEFWELKDPDPMMGNQAAAHNIFVRDIHQFKHLYPNLRVEILNPIKGLAFLISGGVHTRLPIPKFLLISIYRLENRSGKWLSIFGLGRLIKITKV